MADGTAHYAEKVDDNQHSVKTKFHLLEGKLGFFLLITLVRYLMLNPDYIYIYI